MGLPVEALREARRRDEEEVVEVKEKIEFSSSSASFARSTRSFPTVKPAQDKPPYKRKKNKITRTYNHVLEDEETK